MLSERQMDVPGKEVSKEETPKLPGKNLLVQSEQVGPHPK